MNFKNMRIEVNEQQPLENIVNELERLGYSPIGMVMEFSSRETIILTNESGYFTSLFYDNEMACDAVLLTLEQLREIK